MHPRAETAGGLRGLISLSPTVTLTVSTHEQCLYISTLEMGLSQRLVCSPGGPGTHEAPATGYWGWGCRDEPPPWAYF